MSVLNAGVARTEITPPLGVQLGGYGPFLERVSTGVHDPLWCRALVLDNGGEPLAIVGCDLVGVHQELTDNVRALVREKLGIAPERVMLTCTHTHSGPNSLPGPSTMGLVSLGKPDGAYLASLTGHIVETIAAAAADRRPARLAVGRTVLEGIGRNRVQSDGTGLIDPELTVLRVADEGSRLRAVLFHYGTHPVVIGKPNRLFSGDWAGDAERRFEEDPTGPTIASLLNGTLGDINPIVALSDPPDWDAVASIGARMHAAVERLLPSLQDEQTVPLAAQVASVRLPLDAPDRAVIARVLDGYDHTPREGDQPYNVTGIPSERLERAWAERMQWWMTRPAPERDYLPIELQAVRVGPLALLGVPAEVLTAIGFAIKQQSPFRMTAVVSCANGFVGYIPRQQDYEDPTSYAAIRAPKHFGFPQFTPQVGDVFVQAASTLLASIEAASTNSETSPRGA